MNWNKNSLRLIMRIMRRMSWYRYSSKSFMEQKSTLTMNWSPQNSEIIGIQLNFGQYMIILKRLVNTKIRTLLLLRFRRRLIITLIQIVNLNTISTMKQAYLKVKTFITSFKAWLLISASIRLNVQLNPTSGNRI